MHVTARCLVIAGLLASMACAAAGVGGHLLIADTDGDGLADGEDNCTTFPDPWQRDTNRDGFGNVCDADLNDDCTVNFLDLVIMKSFFFTNDPDADLNGDGVVNFGDLARMKQTFFETPGPSGVPNACHSTAR